MVHVTLRRRPGGGSRSNGDPSPNNGSHFGAELPRSPPAAGAGSASASAE